jgi:hypothetical protein
MDQRQDVRRHKEHGGRADSHLSAKAQMRPEPREWDRPQLDVGRWEIAAEESRRWLAVRVQPKTMPCSELDQLANQAQGVRLGARTTDGNGPAGVNADEHDRIITQLPGFLPG